MKILIKIPRELPVLPPWLLFQIQMDPQYIELLNLDLGVKINRLPLKKFKIFYVLYFLLSRKEHLLTNSSR
jgi:hypothetical protein